MGQVRNDMGEIRVMPTLDYSGVEPGRVLPIPDEDVYHWVAGGWTPLTRYPVPHRLFPNHQADPLAYALPEPDAENPSAIAVGTPAPAQTAQQASATAPAQTSAATAPTAASTTATATQTVDDAKEQQA